MENQHEKRKNNAAEEEERFSKLPIDICLDILSRLPRKTISNCRWVSKKWYAFITHRRLAEIHFARFREALPCAFFDSRSGVTHLIAPDYLHTQQTTPLAYAIELKGLRKCFEVVGTVNGMICFSPDPRDYEPVPYYICNPITSDYVLLPKSPRIDVRPIGSGFGFDSLNNEYKVVRILHNSSFDGNEVEIYTLGSGMWRQIQIAVPPYVASMASQDNVLLNGRLHWNPYIHYDTIFSFNVATEEFDSIKMPPIGRTRRSLFSLLMRTLDLIVLGDCLCVVDGGDNDSKDIWVMKVYGVDSSWVKQYVVQHDNFFCSRYAFHQALDLKNNVLLLLNREGILCYYDYLKQTFKKILIRDLKGDQVKLRSSCRIYFTKSLFSPKAIEGNQ